MVNVFLRDRKGEDRGESHVAMEAELGVMCLQAKQGLGTTRSWKRQGRILP